MLYDDSNGDAFEVPQRAQGKTGDKVPDAPLQLRRRMIEDGIDGADGALLSTASPENRLRRIVGKVDAARKKIDI